MADDKNLIDLVVDDNAAEFAQMIHDMLYNKAADVMDTARVEVAQTLFNKEEEPEEEVAESTDPLDEAEKKVGPMSIHLNSTSKKKGGLPAYKVAHVGAKVKRISKGSHLTDTELDDLKDAGHKIKVLD